MLCVNESVELKALHVLLPCRLVLLRQFAAPHQAIVQYHVHLGRGETTVASLWSADNRFTTGIS